MTAGSLDFTTECAGVHKYLERVEISPDMREGTDNFLCWVEIFSGFTRQSS